ncbi:bifunctional metallophosphatase/5'-nucleotidase [Meiothermus taiwanensis]|jgi:5'-nucleotidase/UDP-sugar diphosphatase|uniref:Trifunctional nucleotide phosphoesterase protein YfkN n=2 Tax=Meiothermus taiwanensis TaxID=172827 RepID=A0A399E4J8_9DEIN|nr:5'-nucleotidase C-terminal domain-containing protein [Meiothermus taiwanensis]AWR87483.1 5'-nucleotidase [Meiothermus taiwanensis WR-220]KIQ56056.1 5'-nucleotidase [Meiothermus taiwanensis]KZK16191.1 multifunctional 2',3'-cyclic-nucleotide 2'-phosphodiesterase/5'-nucleotidase/3'-nucleotidase [Meiothermus taiwanensis]RIH78473.1 Trifunctional nucleotide phosphoesterase protein YfkN [Meiothermus taiwanensis]
MRRREVLKAGLLGGAALAGLTRAQGGSFTMTIVHINDTHAHLEPTGGLTLGGRRDQRLGGFARVISLFDRLRATATNPLFLHAGDVFQGTLYFNQYQGLADRHFLHRMGIRALAPGNHEYNLGPDGLANFLNGVRFPVVSANTDVSREPKLAGRIKPYAVVSVGGQRVGIIGLTTPDTPIMSSPGPNVRFTDPVAATQQAVVELLAKGVKYIVVLSHLGYLQDQELARRVTGVQVIVGGHSHTLLGQTPFPELRPGGPYPTIVKNPENKDVLIVQAWEWAKVVGRLQVTFDERGELVAHQGQVIPLTTDLPEDRFALDAISAYGLPIAALRAQVISRAAVTLNGERNDVRRRETNLANLIADAMLWKTRQAGTTIALQNGGGIRATIPAGNITVGQVNEVLPFGNTLVVLELRGSEVLAALENGASQWEQIAGRFLSGVAGLRYTFDLSRPAGSRVTQVQVQTPTGFQPLDPNATYRVVTNNFIAGGGDGFTVLRDAKGLRVDTGFSDAEVLIEYLRTQPSWEPRLENRITILNEPRSQRWEGPFYTDRFLRVGV